MYNTRVFETRHGKMHLIDDDPWVSRSLREQGEWSESELTVMREIFDILKLQYPDGIEVVDAGAYIGDLTIPMSRLVKKVHAFEPQPEVADILKKNLDLNGITNVEVFPYALGHRNGPVTYNQLDALHSPGSTQMSMDDTGSSDAEMRTLDSFGINPQFIKVDVEGMEMFVLNGAKETLKLSGPILFFEHDIASTVPNAPPWDDYLRERGYFIYRKMGCPIYNPENFKKAPNTFANYASMMALAVPLFGPNSKLMLDDIQKAYLEKK